MITIPLTRGQFALVDDCDAYLANHRWYAVLQSTGRFYAARSAREGGKLKTQRMHRVILPQAERGDLGDDGSNSCGGGMLFNGGKMKLSELKVGMTVHHPDYYRDYQVLCVGKWSVYVKTNGGGSEIAISRDDGWISVEPRKKPSERIRELQDKVSYQANQQVHQHIPLELAIMEYLDEQAESKERP